MKDLNKEQIKLLRGDFSITHTCVSCEEEKPVNAFTPGKKGLCNVCVCKQRNTNQAFIDRKNKVLFDREMRKANSEYEFMTDRELRG